MIKVVKQALMRVPGHLTEPVMARRWWLVAANQGCAVLALVLVYFDTNTVAAAIHGALAGVLFSNGMHTLMMPGLLSQWKEIEKNNIQGKLHDAFSQMMERHAENDFPIAPDDTRKPN